MLTTWDAVSTLDRIFDDIMGSALGAATNTRTFVPDVDVRTNDDEVLVVCDVPGLKLEDIDVTLQNHVLSIKGARRFDANENEQVMLGRSYGAFERKFTLPDSLDESKLSATLADGVLTISVPKLPSAKPVKIQVSRGPTPKQLKG
ncbi:MAG: Hsp20/alpha crystallin family protein [Polyangiaceae bacterium]